MSTQDEAWFCSDDGVFLAFRNEPQAIITLCFFVILLPLSFHFFHNLGLITCCDCCDSIAGTNTAQSPPGSPRASPRSPKSPKKRWKNNDHSSNKDRYILTKARSISPAPSNDHNPTYDTDPDINIRDDDMQHHRRLQVGSASPGSPASPSPGTISFAQSPSHPDTDHDMNDHDHPSVERENSKTKTFTNESFTNTKSNNNSSDKLPSHKPRLARKATSTDGTRLGSRFRSKTRGNGVNKQEQKEMHKYRNAYAAFIIICLLFLFFTVIGKFSCFDVFNVDPQISRAISVFGHVLMYLSFGLAMLIIFGLRLKQTFDHSLYQISRQTFRNIIIGTSVVPIFVVVGLIFFYLEVPQATYILCFIGDVTYCGVAFFLLYMFISRLRKVKHKIQSTNDCSFVFEVVCVPLLMIVNVDFFVHRLHP